MTAKECVARMVGDEIKFDLPQYPRSESRCSEQNATAGSSHAGSSRVAINDLWRSRVQSVPVV
jgi:hypothetical protein